MSHTRQGTTWLGGARHGSARFVWRGRGWDRRGEPPEVRLAARQARTAPLVEDFGVWLRQQPAGVSPKSRLGENLAYIGNHWDGLQVFLTDGRVEMHNNVAENAIRPLALNRKNGLFAGHDEDGAAWARIASLVETAKMNRVNPHAHMPRTTRSNLQFDIEKLG